jgi:DNA-binding beta-propeller fold protein YncE
MSDYISGLRQDLVEAATREQQRGRAGRIARPLRPRAWSPATALGAAAALAAALLLVVGLRAVSPPSPPAAFKVVDTVQLGGQPRDAAIAGGALVIADLDGRLVRLSPADPRNRNDLEVGGSPTSIAADGGTVWVTSVSSLRDLNRSYLVQLDTGSGRRLARVPLDGYASHVAVGAGGVWLSADLHAGGLARFDPRTGERTAFVPSGVVEGLAVSDRAVWTRSRDVVRQYDAAGRVLNRVAGIPPTLGEESQRTMVADAHGAWVVGQGDGRLYRIEGGHVVKRVGVGESAGVIARTGAAVWVSASPAIDRYELVRIDPDEGKVTGRVDLGRHRMPQAIVPVGEKLWVITSAGEALLVGPD